MFEKVLVLSPHTDDGEIGAGGFIAKLLEAGCDVYYLAFSHVGRMDLKGECEASLEALGISKYRIYDFKTRRFPSTRQSILQLLWDFNEANDVDLVLTPSTLDFHQDHRTVTEEAVRAFRSCSILGYIQDWNHIVTRHNCKVILEARHVEKKVEAIRQYESQGHREYLTEEAVRSLMKLNAINTGGVYAEAFEVIRLVVP